MFNQMIENIKEQHLKGDEVEEFLLGHIFGGGAALIALSSIHEEEGVYTIKFSFKLNTKKMEIEPLGGLKVDKLRGKTND